MVSGRLSEDKYEVRFTKDEGSLAIFNCRFAMANFQFLIVDF